jgi:hypothetical protein
VKVPQAAKFRTLKIVAARLGGDEIEHLIHILLDFAVRFRMVEEKARLGFIV